MKIARFALAAFAGSLASYGPAFSATVSDGSSPRLAKASDTAIEEVIVTARRKEERQQDVPLAITTLNEEFLRENAVLNLHDLNGAVPALRIDNFNSPLYTNVGIRGQRSTNVAPGQDSTVGYYFAEFNHSFPVGINQQVFDLQSLEIVKGPQGTLFGKNTTGGAVVITPAKPTREFEGLVTVGMTDFKHGSGYYSTAVINIPVNDVLQLRAGLNVVNHDGYVKNNISPARQAAYELVPWGGATNRNMNNEDSQAWRISALLTPSSALQSYFLVQGGHYSDNGTAYTLTALNPASAVGAAIGIQGGNAAAVFRQIQSMKSGDFWSTQIGDKAYNKYDGYLVSNTTTWKSSDTLTLKNIIGYREWDSHQSIAIGGVPYQVLDPKINDKGHEFSEEFQLQGASADQSFNWVAGLYYATQENDHPHSTNVLPQFGLVPNDQFDSIKNESTAIFAQGTYKFAAVDGLSATVGYRHTEDKREMHAWKYNNTAHTACGFTTDAGVPLPVSACFLNGSVTYNEPTYNFSLDYKADADTLVYLARRKGYRAGGWNYTPNNPRTFGPFRPEFVYDWEVGFKKDWHPGQATIRTNAALYTQKYTDAQRFIPPASDPSAFSVINAASATLNGGELEVTVIPARGLEFSGYVSHINAKYDNFQNPALFAGNFTGNKFGQVPETQYSLRFKYQLPLDESIGYVTLAADYTHTGDVYYTDTAQGPGQGPTDSQFQKAYGILNLRADWKSVMRSRFDLAAYVKNAGETKYNTFAVQLYPSLGYNIAAVGEPRVYGFEATFHF